jgi:hypothetical protein
VYILIFSATRQAGALMFSLAFWTTSALVYEDRIRKSLLICSIGIAILFGSINRSPLQFHTYPPYGLYSTRDVPPLCGIFTSATQISRDSELRKEFYRNASAQLSLLKSIGVSQMEKELKKKYKIMGKKVEPGINKDYSEENVKQILHEVLSELYYSIEQERTREIIEQLHNTSCIHNQTLL